MKALLHVHSSYSHDGVPSLELLAEWGTARGLDLIFLSEHTNDFDAAKMARFVEHCERLAGAGCTLVPGLEFPVRGGFHLLGYNVRTFQPILDAGDAARFIHDQGGLAVLAHPGRYGGRWPSDSAIGEMDGVEAWNARYDGRFVPSATIVTEATRRFGGRGHARLFGGQDLHDLTRNRLIVTTGPGGGLGSYFSGLREGRTRFGAPPVEWPSRGDAGFLFTKSLFVLHPAYRELRRIRDRWLARGREPAGLDRR